MAVTAKVFCASDGSPTPHDGRYVSWWNPHTEAGVLECVTTDDLAEAKTWATITEVFAERRTVSKVQPTRPWDGLPNRPLMGIAVEIDNVPTR
jgi:hypothetical protein